MSLSVPQYFLFSETTQSTMKKYFLILIIALFASCSAPKETVRTEYVTKVEYKDRVVHDSVYVDRYTNIYTKGDTVFSERTIYKYRDRFIHDTARIVDTVSNVVKETEFVTERVNVYWPSFLIIGLFVVLVIAYKIYIKR